ncbi:uncharacterized protein BDCG_17792 [Blastomyces dermatitidis ER-3]|uniref:Uncharacterized protein n=1 Tax=Ajellomyces dermatitidis (strain ER-3 / ATCC MYA-2586) TaxID=559297 RepID=A0ABX2W0B3_AJEDR|nr:uncharacterized protein BDCG_17792 [Blastomyces dermatitidis ER-3]OAT02827.1 hypothetical protein BDCG_17792 [Blastomyces dermatitidis ER-3]
MAGLSAYMIPGLSAYDTRPQSLYDARPQCLRCQASVPTMPGPSAYMMPGHRLLIQ